MATAKKAVSAERGHVASSELVEMRMMDATSSPWDETMTEMMLKMSEDVVSDVDKKLLVTN